MSDFVFEQDYRDKNLARERWACSRGCMPCGAEGDDTYHSGSCCGSTICGGRWDRQVQTWLRIENEYNTQLWLHVEKETQKAWCEAEAAFREKVASHPKVHVRQQGSQALDPAERRGVAKKVRQRHTVQNRAT